MPSHTPEFVFLDTRKIKVQQWRQLTDRVVLTTLVHGEAAGNDLLKQLRSDGTTLAWDEQPPLPVRPEVTIHRVVGSGPTTVHRIEMTLWFTEDVPPLRPPAPADKLDQILRELQMLRSEVAELRAHRQNPGPSTSLPTAGRTLLDFDIDTEEDV